MPFIIAYAIAGICATALIVLWFAASFNKLADKHQDILAAEEQTRIHLIAFRSVRGCPDAEKAKKMLDTSRLIYRESVNEYNRTYGKLIYHFPGFILGFRSIRPD